MKFPQEESVHKNQFLVNSRIGEKAIQVGKAPVETIIRKTIEKTKEKTLEKKIEKAITISLTASAIPIEKAIATKPIPKTIPETISKTIKQLAQQSTLTARCIYIYILYIIDIVCPNYISYLQYFIFILYLC